MRFINLKRPLNIYELIMLDIDQRLEKQISMMQDLLR
jgi:hypothetical protein